MFAIHFRLAPGRVVVWNEYARTKVHHPQVGNPSPQSGMHHKRGEESQDPHYNQYLTVAAIRRRICLTRLPKVMHGPSYNSTSLRLS